MKIAILTDHPKLYSQIRLMQAGSALGHEMILLKASHCFLNITQTPPRVYYRDEFVIEDLDRLVPRLTNNTSSYGMALLKQFEWMGVKSLNSALSIHTASDKIRALQLMVHRQVAMPITGYADSPQEAEKLIEVVGGAPLMVKLLEGRKGHGTVYASTHQAAVSVINALKQLKANILVQECIPEARGHDIRAMVIGQKVVAAIQRKPADEDDLTPFDQQKATAIKLSPTERKMATFAVKAMKLNCAVVHLLRAHRGPLVLNIDPTPNFELIEKVTGLDIASAMITHVCVETDS